MRPAKTGVCHGVPLHLINQSIINHLFAHKSIQNTQMQQDNTEQESKAH